MISEDRQLAWEQLVSKAFSDYGSLSAGERIWFNVDVLIDSVNDGGLVSFYYNSGADHLKETMEDLATIEAHAVLALLDRINEFFPGGSPSTNIDERNAVIAAWESEGHDDILDTLDQEFFGLEASLQEKLEPVVLKLLEK